MVVPWILSSQSRVDRPYGRHHGWGMDGLCSDLITPWTQRHRRGEAMSGLFSERLRP